MKRIAIIGGGASGLAAAIAAGEAARDDGFEVEISIYEASDRVGRSILATGNGRCNFSNAFIDVSHYHNAGFVGFLLRSFQRRFPSNGSPNGVVDFFATHGLAYREEGEGRLYPLANKASVVLDVMRACLRSVGAIEVTDARVNAVEPPRGEGKPYTLKLEDGRFERAEAVIVACGGRIARQMLPDDMAFIEQRPVLCPLATEERIVRELDNIRVKGSVTLIRDGRFLASERGEIMFRKYGVSGICVFNLSRFAEPGDVISIDFLPDWAPQDLHQALQQRYENLLPIYGRTMGYADYLRGMLLPHVADVTLKSMGIADRAMLPRHFDAKSLAHTLKSFSLHVEGPADVEHAQVQRGGFDVGQFNPETCQSISHPGLYVTGEALDVDGPCGGYNLHWAFATGLLAGHCAAHESHQSS